MHGPSGVSHQQPARQPVPECVHLVGGQGSPFEELRQGRTIDILHDEVIPPLLVHEETVIADYRIMACRVPNSECRAR